MKQVLFCGIYEEKTLIIIFTDMRIKTSFIALIVAMLAILVFWIAGIKGFDTVAIAALVVAGVSGFIALGAEAVYKLRNRHLV